MKMIFTFFTISSSSISDLLGYIGALWSDLTPILVVVLGLFLGIWIFAEIIKLFSTKEKIRREHNVALLEKKLGESDVEWLEDTDDDFDDDL